MNPLHYLEQFFKYEHLPEKLQNVSKPFCILAGTILATLPDNPERTTALRKLLEAKDCAVRAIIFE
jgi:ferritin-like protein